MSSDMRAAAANRQPSIDAAGAGSLEIGAQLVRASGVAAEIAKGEREQGSVTQRACLAALDNAILASRGRVDGDEARSLQALGNTLCAVTLDLETQQR